MFNRGEELFFYVDYSYLEIIGVPVFLKELTFIQ